MSFIRNNYIKLLSFAFAFLGIVIFPISDRVLDMLIVFNIILSVLLTLISFVFLVMPPQSIYPYCLMSGSFFRIMLGLAITRRILLNTDAGNYVFRTGDFVLGQNALIGSAIFLFLILSIFYVVYSCIRNTTKIACHSISNLEESKTEYDKELLSWENTRAAMRVFKNEAIVHAFLVLTNFLGGYVIATALFGVTSDTAVQNCTLLTFGTGLVILVPILFIAVAVNLTICCKKDIDNNKTLALILFVAAISLLTKPVFLLLFGLIPGMPLAGCLIISAAGALISFILCAIAKWCGSSKKEVRRHQL